jgi:hypothetical protein
VETNRSSLLLHILLHSNLLLSVVVAHAQTLQNESTRLAFDVAAGTYSLMTGSALAISNAHAAVEGWSSADAGYQRKITAQDKDRLLVECSRPDAPTLLLEFTLHPGFLELRGGLRNTTGRPVRIKKFEPLAGGAVFPGEGWTDVRTLDAPSGANQPRVTGSAVRSSANNLLLTFKQAGVRRSLAMGALKTADFNKWARTSSGAMASRRLELPGLRPIGYLDCGGADNSQQVFRVVRGRPYAWEGAEEPCGSVLFDEKSVEFRVDNLDPQKRYALGFSWWDRDANGRVESVTAGGTTLIAKCAVPTKAEIRTVALPPECHRDGTLSLAFTNDANVPNAVVSEIWLWEMDAGAKLPDTLPEEDSSAAGVTATLEANDPLGKLVEAGETYMPADSFYVDAATPNPFEALEKYGHALREATGAKPNPYDFPTVCAWYAGVWKTRGAQDHPNLSTYRINTTAGLVEEAQKMKASGFLDYSRAAGRLVPDNYTEQNPQGWWDDEHWRQQGLYTAPYETSAKYGEGMHRFGTLAFTYIQPTSWSKGPISLDFRQQHTGWLCGRDVKRTLDYSIPEVQEYLRKNFGALRGHIDGLMVDYCDELWNTEASRGGFADPHMTATAFYRQFLRCVKDGLGPSSWLHERSVQSPNNDLALGISDSQRTSWDTDKITPDMVSRSGLRWYKNRVVLAYDMDSKELTSAWKVGGWNGTDQDGRRMLLTMAYVAASRLLLANSFRDLSPEILHDLERTFPYPTEPRSARPVDAFAHDGWPRVYDYAVTPDWHQVTLFNTSLPTREETITVPLSGDTAAGALGLDPAAEYYVYDFWNDRLVGRLKGEGPLSQTLRPGEARMLSVRKVEDHPQVLSTDRHVMQGCLELSDVKWDGYHLAGKAKVVAGEALKIVIACNGRYSKDLKLSEDNWLGVLTIERSQNETVEWSINFR